MDTSEIKEKLKCSLELAHLRSKLVICTIITAAYIGVFTLAWGGWVLALVVGLLVIVPLWCWDGWRIWRIFRETEEYVFCKVTLSQPHASKINGVFYFTIVLETPERGQFLANTTAIFQARGWLGPLLEDYVNRKVTVAYNLSTEQVVVVG